MTPDILLIGTGITNALTANFLLKAVPTANIITWDKSKGFGGRMSKSISPEDKSCAADIGAQYITTNTETMAKYDDVYGPLLRDGLIEEMTANVGGMRKFDVNTRHFVAPNGMNSIVEYFFRHLPAENVRFGSRVVAIDEENGKFTVQSEESSLSVDVVVSTMPVPEFLQLTGSVNACVEKSRTELERIRYSSRFVLVFFYKTSVTLPGTDSVVKYLDDEVFRFVSVDNVKRNRPDEPVAVIFHTSVQFGLDNMDKTIPEVEKVLVKRAREVFPDWPEPTATKCHKWRFSQVVEGFPGKPGLLVLNRNPMLVLSGDAFSQSNFDGCVYSAMKTVETVRRNLKNCSNVPFSGDHIA